MRPGFSQLVVHVLVLLLLACVVVGLANAADWPKNFNPETQRVVIGPDKKPVVHDICPEVIEIRKQTRRGMPFWEAQPRLVGSALRGCYVDNAIDAWGWNATSITRARRGYGYTWVPNLLMPPIDVAPGLQVPGLKPYDPNNPPVGAILVPPAAVVP